MIKHQFTKQSHFKVHVAAYGAFDYITSPSCWLKGSVKLNFYFLTYLVRQQGQEVLKCSEKNKTKMSPSDDEDHVTESSRTSY